MFDQGRYYTLFSYLLSLIFESVSLIFVKFEGNGAFRLILNLKNSN